MSDRSEQLPSPPVGRSPVSVWRSPVLVLLLGCAAGVIAISRERFRADAPPRPSSPAAKAALPAWPPATPLPWPDSRYENTTPGVEYVGSSACRECHPVEFESYLATSHSRAIRAASSAEEPPDGAFVHQASRRRYEVYRNGGRLRHREVLLLPDGGDRPTYDFGIDYTLGSGRFGHAYLAAVDGFLVQSPVTWYTERATWGLSPGYEGPQHMSFRRYLSDECLFCHTGITSRQGANSTRLTFREMSIGCERCHGPGSRHVARHRSGSGRGSGSEIDYSIVNPADLTGKQQEAVCAQCHLRDEADALVRGRRMDEFRPGLPLDQFRVDYRREEPEEGMSVVGHYAQLRQSRCYTASDALNCLTCHDPHRQVGPGERVEHYRNLCLRCHAQDGCGLPGPERDRIAANDCAHCHMPAAATEVPHVAFTHHRIGIHSAASSPPQSRMSGLAAGEFIPTDAPDLPAIEQVRLLGLAHFARLKASGGGPGGNHHRRQAQQLLNDALQRGAGDAPVRTALAELAWRGRDASTAAMLCESVIAEQERGTREWVDAVSILAEAAFAREDFAGARGLYEQLAQLRYDARYWFFLGLCEQNCGHTGAAIHALEKSLEIDPVQTGAHQVLAALHQRLGSQEAESVHRRTLSSIERFLAELESPGHEGDGLLRKETEDASSGP